MFQTDLSRSGYSRAEPLPNVFSQSTFTIVLKHFGLDKSRRLGFTKSATFRSVLPFRLTGVVGLYCAVAIFFRSRQPCWARHSPTIANGGSGQGRRLLAGLKRPFACTVLRSVKTVSILFGCRRFPVTYEHIIVCQHPMLHRSEC